MKIDHILFPSFFFKITDPFDGRSFLMCSQDPFFGTNEIGPLKTNRVNGPLKAKMLYLTSRIMGEGVHFANSETEKARTIKLCTVISHYITSIIKQLKFLNSHCSIVCGYCFVVCLIAKSS